MKHAPLFWAALALAGCGKASNSQPLDLGMEQQIGYEFVQQRGCPTCHQSPSAADGILSGQTTPVAGTKSVYGSNLSSDVATGLGGWADIEIVRAMLYGTDNMQLPLCPAMPHYDGTQVNVPVMTDKESSAIVAYLRALPAVKRQIPTSVCPPIEPIVVDMAMAHD